MPGLSRTIAVLQMARLILLLLLFVQIVLAVVCTLRSLRPWLWERKIRQRGSPSAFSDVPRFEEGLVVSPVEESLT